MIELIDDGNFTNSASCPFAHLPTAAAAAAAAAESRHHEPVCGIIQAEPATGAEQQHRVSELPSRSAEKSPGRPPAATGKSADHEPKQPAVPVRHAAEDWRSK